MADPVNLDIIQGATFNLSVTWNDTSLATPSPQSLAGYRAHMQIRRKVGDPSVIIDLRSDGTNPDIVMEPGNVVGLVAINIPATQTVLLTRNCAYDLFLIQENNPAQAVRLLFGTITVERAVTQES